MCFDIITDMGSNISVFFIPPKVMVCGNIPQSFYQDLKLKYQICGHD